MIKGYWIKFTKECLQFQNVDYIDDYLSKKKIKNDVTTGEILTCLVWLLSKCVIQSEKGHFLLDKSVFISKESLDLLWLSWTTKTLIRCLEILKSLNMLVYENEKEFYGFIEDSYKEI